MRRCAICKTGYLKGSGQLFRVPKDIFDRKRWSKICGIDFKPSALVCANHFSPSRIVNVRNKATLLRNTVPFITSIEGIDTPSEIIAKKYNARTTKHHENIIVESHYEQLTQDILISNMNATTAALQQETIVEIPVIKSILCSTSTQTNTRLCGLVEVSEFADEFRFTCFYCDIVFPLQKYKHFIKHLKKVHFENEAAFKVSEYISLDHDYTPKRPTPPASEESNCNTVVINAGPASPLHIYVSPPESAFNPIESHVLDPELCCILNNESANNNNFNENFTSLIELPISENKTFCMSHNINKPKSKSTKRSILSKYTINSPPKVIFSGVSLLKESNRQPLKKTALSRCLKRTNTETIKSEDKEKYMAFSLDNVQQKSTEIAFEYTPRDVVDSLLDSMKIYPILWKFDKERFNEDFYDAVEDLCKIINEKWSLHIDNLKMRRSINRILRFYCYLYPNANIENIHQFTNYYDKCATFLPTSVNEIAYARCSHCYVCFKNDFELKSHLLEEFKYLQWPYKCVQCKECFRESDEFEFHKILPHYDEIFRCEPCKKTFVRRNIYNKHMSIYHPKGKIVKHKCDVCGKAYQTKDSLRTHKISHRERTFQCQLCPKSYFLNSELVRHLKSHRKEYDFICEVCGKAFLLQAHLKQHMKMHTEAKVTCNICNLKLRKSSLSRHLRLVHVACEGTLEATFRAKNYHYNRFVRPTPSRRKRDCERRHYNCRICKIDFDNYNSIVKHNNEFHFDTPKWPCEMCYTQFSQKINLKRHYRKKHGLVAYQVYKLVEQHEDLNKVLGLKSKDLENCDEKSIGSHIERDNVAETHIIKTEFIPDDIYFEEKADSSTIQDEIITVADNMGSQEIKLEFMNDFFTDLLKEHQKHL